MRLCGIAENQNILPTFVKNAFENFKINIIGGQQAFSWLDVEDATEAIVMLLNISMDYWKTVYNVSLNNANYNIVDIANIVVKRMKERFNKDVEISIKKDDSNFRISIDSSLFISDTGWQPKRSLEYTIDKVIDEYLKNYKNNII